MSQNPIESDEQFEKDAKGQHERWQVEIDAATKNVKKWWSQGDKIVKRFLDERTRTGHDSKLNLFSANVQTQRAMLYGQTPAVQVDRRFADADDDQARVAGEMLERLLNSDIELDGDTYRDALYDALSDRLLAGLAVARVRYEAEFEERMLGEMGMQPIPEGVEITEDMMVEEVKTFEDAVVDYVHWKDFLWSPARVWSEVRWIAYRAYLTKDEAEKRFGDKAQLLQYSKSSARGQQNSEIKDDPWQRSEVWEIWCKDSGMVYWYSKGAGLILDEMEDPLELEGFFPSPKPLFANLTTSNLIPRPDFLMAQDQYLEIDNLTQRINTLQKAVKAVGVYDKSSDGLRRMLQEGVENDLIPVDNWAAFAEKGGLQGQVVWMPLVDVVNAMDKLREYRKELIELLYQITGMSDIMRGAASEGMKTATEQMIKAQFGSVRVQEIQKQFVEFATDLQKLKAEVIVKHFDDQTIFERSNIQFTVDAQLAQPALQLLRSHFLDYRVEIESEQIAAVDHAKLRNERTEYLEGLSRFMQTAAPMATQVPGSMPFLLEMLKIGMSGFRGSRQIETVMDKAIEAASQQQQQPQEQGPDPEQVKAQAKMQEVQMKGQQKMAEIERKAQADMQRIQAETQARMQELQAEQQADASREATQAHFNIQEEAAKAKIRSGEKVITAQFTGQP